MAKTNDAAVPRRAVLRHIAVSAAAFAGCGPLRLAAAQQKVSKEEAKYQDQPKGVQRCEMGRSAPMPGANFLLPGRMLADAARHRTFNSFDAMSV
ncbi:MAG: hypothetical protein E6G81_05105 [Alphaproteobacteria bacterium]|nr:MAG: hypothetical protein E6G81_05105 [Alphaproteobacteria bacterium]